MRRVLSSQDVARLRADYIAGDKPDVLAQRYGCSRRTVFRWVNEPRLLTSFTCPQCRIDIVTSAPGGDAHSVLIGMVHCPVCDQKLRARGAERACSEDKDPLGAAAAELLVGMLRAVSRGSR